MLTRASRLLLVSGLILACAPAGYASFIGDISMSDADLPDKDNVAPSTAITLDVAAEVTYEISNPGDDVTWIQLSFGDSSTALSLSSATWTWDSDTDVISGMEDESDMSGSIVSRQGASGITATSFDIGVLSFNAPAALGTYTVNLTAGDADTEPKPDNTLMADGITTTIYEDNGLTLGTFSFTVVPEPGTAALLACGALAALLRRRKAKA